MTSLCSDIGLVYWTVKAAGLAGTLLLALPVLAIDSKHRSAAGFDARAPRDMDPGIEKARHLTAQRLWNGATQWNRWHSRCLWIGYALLLGSGIGAFIADIGCTAN